MAANMCQAAANGDHSRVEELLQTEDAYLHDEFGLTPLIHAAKAGHAHIVMALLKAGAPWNALDPSGRCAGDYAMEAGHQEAYDILLEAGVQAELVLGAAARREKNGAVSNIEYLEARLNFSEGKILDEENEAVMMAWEKPLMEAHAKAVCHAGGDILNVGFGMGLVDTAIQQYNPSSHTIIEAHPDVYARMISSGWADKPNVRIIFGRWQDVLPQLQQYDGIFFDTYGEYYEDMREFHSHISKLLKAGGLYSFFNGLCGHNPFFHMVYCQVVALELSHFGLSTQYISLPVSSCLDSKIWQNVNSKYWQLDTYLLPACQAHEQSLS